MELTQLRYFKAAAEESNFTRAAQKLSISQPALSKAVQHLENEIGLKLFVRDGNKIALNRYGQVFLEEVNSALLHLETGLKNLAAMAGQEYGHISIAISAATNILKPVEEFLIEHPNVNFKEVPADAKQMEALLLSGQVDFGVTYDWIDNPKIDWLSVYEDRMSVLLPKGHPLSDRKEIRLKELENERVLQGDSFGRLSYVFDFSDGSVYSPNIVYEGTDKSLVGRLVSANVGIAFAPLSVSLSLHSKDHFPYEDGALDLAYIPLVDTFWHRTLGIVTLHDHFISKAASEFIDRIRAHYAKLPPAY